MNHSEAAAARDRLEAALRRSANDNGAISVNRNTLAAVCAWTRHWEHCADEIGRIDDRLRAHHLTLGLIANHDITDIDADTASRRVWNAYLHVKDLAAQALEAIGLTGDEIRERYLKTDDDGIPFSAKRAVNFDYDPEPEALDAK